MSIRNTESERCVALFDSVTMEAFGPTFDSGPEADSFITYCLHHYGAVQLNKVSRVDIDRYYRAWWDLTHDEVGEVLDEGVPF